MEAIKKSFLFKILQYDLGLNTILIENPDNVSK